MYPKCLEFPIFIYDIYSSNTIQTVQTNKSLIKKQTRKTRTISFRILNKYENVRKQYSENANGPFSK